MKFGINLRVFFVVVEGGACSHVYGDGEHAHMYMVLGECTRVYDWGLHTCMWLGDEHMYMVRG